VSNPLLGEGDDVDQVSLDDIETLLLRKAVDRTHRWSLAGCRRLDRSSAK
jgi:hypothetical protein